MFYLKSNFIFKYFDDPICSTFLSKKNIFAKFYKKKIKKNYTCGYNI